MEKITFKIMPQLRKFAKGLVRVWLLFSALLAAPIWANIGPALKNPDEVSKIPGCDDYALCDKSMGAHILEWQKLINTLRSKDLGPQKVAQEIENFRIQSGLPMEFYSNQRAFKQFSPVLWDSPCKNHQHEDKNKQVYLAMSFVKDAKNGQGQIIHKGVVHFIPRGELFSLDPVLVYDPSLTGKALDKKNPPIKTYFVPKGETPVVISQTNLVMPREDEGVYYYLHVGPKGDFKVRQTFLKSNYDAEEVACSEEVVKIWKDQYSKLYEGSFCREIWDIQANKKMHMLLSWSCS